jgi:hypothetical protein
VSQQRSGLFWCSVPIVLDSTVAPQIIAEASPRRLHRFNCTALVASFAERRAIYKTGCRCFGGFIFIDLPSLLAHPESNPMPASVKLRFGIPHRLRTLPKMLGETSR